MCTSHCDVIVVRTCFELLTVLTRTGENSSTCSVLQNASHEMLPISMCVAGQLFSPCWETPPDDLNLHNAFHGFAPTKKLEASNREFRASLLVLLASDPGDVPRWEFQAHACKYFAAQAVQDMTKLLLKRFLVISDGRISATQQEMIVPYLFIAFLKSFM